MDLIFRSEAGRRSLRYLGSWLLLALVAGILGSGLTMAFTMGLSAVKQATSTYPLPLIAVLGAILAAAISRLAPESRGEGIPSYIRGIREHGGRLPFRAGVVKVFSSFATLGTWGSGGVVGPLGRVSAGFTSSLVSTIPLDDDEQRALVRNAAICGLASVMASVTGAPIGSGVFAVEIIQKRNMRYSDLFPAVLAASVASFLARSFGFRPLYELYTPSIQVQWELLFPLLVVGLLAALASHLFERFYLWLSKRMGRSKQKGVEIRFASATFVAVLLLWLVNPQMMGNGVGLVHSLAMDPAMTLGRFGPAFPIAFAALVLIVVQALAVALTVGSGQSAGFFTPLATMGMLLGTAVGALFGFTGNLTDLHLLQGAGMAGVLAGSLNVPLAAAILVSEVFGSHLGFPAALAAIFSFQVNRHHTLYDAALSED